MSLLPRAVHDLGQAILDKAPASIDAGKNAFKNAKPAFASGLEIGKQVSTTALQHAKPLLQTTLQAGKNAPAAVLARVKPTLTQFPDFQQVMQNIFARTKPLLSSGFEFGKRAEEQILPFFLALQNLAWNTIRQHPVVSTLATLYALMSLVLGPIWPLRVILWFMGFGAKGVALGMYTFGRCVTR